MEIKEKTQCPSCGAELIILNDLLYCEAQKIYIGKPESLENTGLNKPTTNSNIYKSKARVESRARITTASRHSDYGYNISLSGPIRRFLSISFDIFLLSILSSAILIWKDWLDAGISLSFQYNSLVKDLIMHIIWYKPLNAYPLALMVMGYFLIFDGIFGKTLGKLIFGERIIKINASKSSLIQRLIRSIFIPIDLLFGFIAILVSSKNQSMGDRLTRTIVVVKNTYGRPIEGMGISSLRKFFAFLLAVAVFGASILLVFSAYSIVGVNKNAKEIIASAKTFGIRHDSVAFYDMFSDPAKLEISQADIEAILANEKFFTALTSMNVDEIVFHEWIMSHNLATLLGQAPAHGANQVANVQIQITLVKDASGAWVLHYLSLSVLDKT
jgi:uncharacterized RDD family membrane protein YckC